MTHSPGLKPKQLGLLMTPNDLHRSELMQSISTAIFAGVTLALCAIPFAYDGRWLVQMIGG
jgi:hypothetical protein